MRARSGGRRRSAPSSPSRCRAASGRGAPSRDEGRSSSRAASPRRAASRGSACRAARGGTRCGTARRGRRRGRTGRARGGRRRGGGRRTPRHAAPGGSPSHSSWKCRSSSKSENARNDGSRCSSTKRVWIPYFGPTSSIRRPRHSRPAATSASPSTRQGEVDVVGRDRRVALVADRAPVARERRLCVELLAVVVERHVARELELFRAPVDGALPGAPAERPRRRRDPHRSTTGRATTAGTLLARGCPDFRSDTVLVRSSRRPLPIMPAWRRPRSRS